MYAAEERVICSRTWAYNLANAVARREGRRLGDSRRNRRKTKGILEQALDEPDRAKWPISAKVARSRNAAETSRRKSTGRIALNNVLNKTQPLKSKGNMLDDAMATLRLAAEDLPASQMPAQMKKAVIQLLEVDCAVVPGDVDGYKNGLSQAGSLICRFLAVLFDNIGSKSIESDEATLPDHPQ
jgi:hypothetical protein